MTQGLDEGSSIPLYAQLRELLKGQIREGAFVFPASESRRRTSSTACMV